MFNGGGEEKNLRENICNTVLEILRNCDKLRPVDEEMNVKYRILENAYLSLEINYRTDKCRVLKDIIRRRDIYTTRLRQEFPLCHCLCSLPEIQNPIEIGFCVSESTYCKNKTKTTGHFYDNNWSKLIIFLRIIIRQIEYDTVLNVNKTSKKLKGIRNELNEEENKRFDNLRREIKESREFHAAQVGPAEEQPNNNLNTTHSSKHPSYLLTNEELAELGINPNGSLVAKPSTNLSQIPLSMLQPVGRRRNFKPNQPPHNSQTPQTNMSNLIARLAELNNN